MPSEQSRADQFLAHIFDPKTRGVKERRLRYRRVKGRLADRRQERRTPAPGGVCEDCWRERRSDCPGQCYSIGYPMLDPKLVTVCPDCAEYARCLNVELTPFSL
jgi:hypothetical protein